MADAPRRTEQRRILRVFELEPAEPVTDTVVREVPLRIVINDREFAVVSMLPGEERELTCGLLLTSGIVKSADDVLDWRHDDKCNTVNIELNVNSSKLDEAVQARARWPASGQPPEFPSAVALAPVKSGMLVPGGAIFKAAESLRQAAGLFRDTGAVHTAALCRADGCVLLSCDDVGRHNACDKVIGAALLRGDITAGDLFMFCTCRLSSEIVTKAWRFGAPLLASRAAPTSLALELAKRAEITIVGFIRDNRFNVYCGEQRIKVANQC